MSADAETILNVDDNEPTRYARTRVLQRAGFQVLDTGSGEEAWRIVVDRRPGLVILDVGLPDVSGTEICRRIKRDYPSVLVLQTSASFVTMHDRVRGLDAGADGYLVEPVEPQELVASARALMRLRRAEEQLRVLADRLEERVAERTRELAETNARLKVEIDDRERAEAELRQALKMEAIGHLTGGIAHDFNNLLTVILGGVERARRHVQDAGAQRMLANAAQAGHQAARLTAQLLSFARKQHFERQPLQLHAMLTRLQSFLQQTIGPLHRVEISNGDDVWPVLSDPSQIESLVLNLVINARDAMPEGGMISVAARNAPAGEAGIPTALSGDQVVLSVTDRGIGMTPEVQARAFEPFFTTKGVGRGTGLGLSMVYGVAKQSGGDVAIESEPGQGTTIRVYLPRASGDVPAAGTGGAAARPASPARRGFTILLIDDDPAVLDYTAETLRDLGYSVIEAGDGPAGLRHLAGDAKVDLLIVDYAMPLMTGQEVAQHALALRPKLPILSMTGFADAGILEELARSFTILKKPFGRMELDAAIAAAMGRAMT
ncbi:MAG: response regulator [Alphaproteobacteria bacterium]|nr:response regulator [Alphaproteobacteria bacterium]